MPAIQIFDTDDILAAQAAELFAISAQEAIAARGRFTVALAGGKTPEKAYQRLANANSSLEWDKVFVFLGDERFVPFDDERSNYGMAQRSLLRHVPVSDTQVFPVFTQSGTPAEAAAAYGDTLAEVLAPPEGTPPVLDLILLGLGDDGHTASLFPGMPSLSVTDAWAVSSPPGVLPPPVDRITLTYPVLNAARQVVFLVVGEKKAAVVRDILQGEANPNQHPAAGVQPIDGMLTWFIDKAAAGLLNGN